MEEEVDEVVAAGLSNVKPRAVVEPLALSSSGEKPSNPGRILYLNRHFQQAAKEIADALLQSRSPLIITSYLGKNQDAVSALVSLSETLAIPVIISCPSVVNMPHNHPHLTEVSFGFGESRFVRTADTILIIDCDVPFIPVHNKPKASARIFHVDVDVLKNSIGAFDLAAEMFCRADACLALSQIRDCIPSELPEAIQQVIADRKEQLLAHHLGRLSRLDTAELHVESKHIMVPHLIGCLRRAIPVPESTLFLIEAISNYPLVWEHLRPEFPGSAIASGSSALGWGLGASIGASLAGGPGTDRNLDLIVLVVGDGSFLFGVPSTAFWMARRYNTVRPFLADDLNC